MLGIAPGLYVKIGVVARDSLSLDGIVQVIGGELLQLVIDLLADEVALLHPSHLAGCGADLDEAAVVVEDFDAVSIFDQAGFFVDGGDAVAQVDLDSGDVGDFEDASAGVFAGDEREGDGGAEQGCGGARQEVGEELHGIDISIYRVAEGRCVGL